MANVTYSFSCGIRGYHEYKTKWVPVLNEVLPVKHESTNFHDRYAIAVMKRLPGTLVASVVLQMGIALPTHGSDISTYIPTFKLWKSHFGNPNLHE